MALKTIVKSDRRRGQGKIYVFGFALLIFFFAWHNAANLSAIRGKTGRQTSKTGSRKRSSLEGDVQWLHSSLVEEQLNKKTDTSVWGLGSSHQDETTLQEISPHSESKEQQKEPWGSNSSNSSSTSDTRMPRETSSSGPSQTDGETDTYVHNSSTINDGTGASKTASLDIPGITVNSNVASAAHQQQRQQQKTGKNTTSKSSMTVDLNHQVLHTPPRVVQAGAHNPTLVIYIYLAIDFEHEERFQYFVRAGIAADDGVEYRMVVADPTSANSLGSLPSLPNNAKYLLPTGNNTCNNTWGAIASVQQQLALASYTYIVVVDSHALGPLLPAYAASVMHWTEVLTGKLSNDTKLVGSYISCEGYPRNGVPDEEWRLNPYVLPHTWATDQVGWDLLASKSNVFQCYDGYWERRYNSDLAASLAMLNAGYNIDSLLLRYQGVDWRNTVNWECNSRIRPDRVNLYDGIMASPYEVVFVPLSMAEAKHRLMLRAADRYSDWAAPKDGYVDISHNAYWSQEFESDWSVRGRKVIALQQRWSCFDDEYYLMENTDVRQQLDSMGNDAVAVWEHFVTLGQFQGRVHRFVCGDPILSKEDAVKLLLQRGRACFDHVYYKQQYTDLGNSFTQLELWLHYVKYGQFENRLTRFVCPESIDGLQQGYDGTLAAVLQAEKQTLLRRFEALLKSQSSIDDAVESLDVSR